MSLLYFSFFRTEPLWIPTVTFGHLLTYIKHVFSRSRPHCCFRLFSLVCDGSSPSAGEAENPGLKKLLKNTVFPGLQSAPEY